MYELRSSFWLCQLYRFVMGCLASELNENMLEGSAVIIAPHPDDETLGCGGTVIRKKHAGADVKIIFMTDGSHSNNKVLSVDELTVIRVNEALAATRMLGVEETALFFLGFEDGRLAQMQEAAVARVAAILQQQQPEEIFIPYSHDPHPDHMAAHKIVMAALQQYQREVVIYEYPIWFWRQWPWTSVPLHSRRKIVKVLRKNVIMNARLLNVFKSRVDIEGVLAQKQAALGEHKSQLTQLVPDPRWLTLGDVANGEFLDCFFQKHEVFHRYYFSS